MLLRHLFFRVMSMRFRWTIEELNTMSDIDMLKGLIAERMGNVNIYAPLYKRLSLLHKKLDSKESLTSNQATGEVGYIGFYTKKHELAEQLRKLEGKRDSLPLHSPRAQSLNSRIHVLSDKINKMP